MVGGRVRGSWVEGGLDPPLTLSSHFQLAWGFYTPQCNLSQGRMGLPAHVTMCATDA